MATTDSPGTGSPLSDIDSEEFVENVKFSRRSRSRSHDSTISASSDDFASPSASTPQHSDMPPAKRRRIGANVYDHATPQSSSALVPPRSPSGSISSDSTSSVPTSPSFAHLGPTHPLSTAYAAAQANPDNPEMADYTQVTQCLWTGCTTPEQGNMDNLVAHINDVHIMPRQKKYFCEWEGCNRKSMPHTSAYALKAHMRSHTKEKPFWCALPECDRCFTRSDALAKHMRTVHETEALRPSDPVPRGHTGGISNGAPGPNGTIKRIKLVMNAGANGEKRASILDELPPLPTRHNPQGLDIKAEDRELQATDDVDDGLRDAVDIDSLPFTLPVSEDYYPADVYEVMDDYERSLPPSQFYRLLRLQVQWASREGTDLEEELSDARGYMDGVTGSLISVGSSSEQAGDEVRKREWSLTEKLLDNVLSAEIGRVSKALQLDVNGDADAPKGVWAKMKRLEAALGGNL